MSIEEDEENGINRHTLTMKVNGEIVKYENVAIRYDRKMRSYQLLTVDYELIDLNNVDWIFNHTFFNQNWESYLRKFLRGTR